MLLSLEDLIQELYQNINANFKACLFYICHLNFSHEVGHSFGLQGHRSGTSEITSYDGVRQVQPREVTEALLAPHVLLAASSN